MISKPTTKYPFFNLIESEEQAELALAALTLFGSEREKKVLKPEALAMQQDFMNSNGSISLAKAINNLLTAYLQHYGEFSDELTIFLSKSLIEQKLALAS